MALRDQPYLPLFVKDFVIDEKLRRCSAESTGVYIRIMCLMHISDEYGVIALSKRDKVSESQLTNFATVLLSHLPYQIDVIERSLDELIDRGVLLVDGDRLIQKRMFKDGKLSLTRSLAGAQGGNAKANGKQNFSKTDSKKLANSVIENEYVNANEIDIDIENANDEKANIQESRFAEFWKVYPKKVGKEAARKSWMKVKPDKALFIKMLEAVETAKKSKQWQKDNGQYIPNPSTWLNQGRWDDELDTGNSSNNPFA